MGGFHRMTNITIVTTIIGEIISLIGIISALVVKVSKVSNGTKCQLRSEMLRIYYHNRETKQIRQYEYENFIMLYEAYKALKGNSFIDKIYEEVSSWDIIT
jgi:hypothetical protein